MGEFIRKSFRAAFAVALAFGGTGLASAEPWRLAVLSDLHIHSDASIPVNVPRVVAEVARLAPRAVVVTGDSTVGNAGDGVPIERVRAWWNSVRAALEPLRAAGIPVLPVAGNHDSYTEAHRLGYAEAWEDLESFAYPLALSRGPDGGRWGAPPRYYSVDLDGAHLTLLDVIDQRIDEAQAEWLRADLARARGASLRIAFGHVPLRSMMGRASAVFEARLGGILASGGAAAYVSGHEHLVWDETLLIGGAPLRQLICGTSSGTYTFGIRPDVYERHCTGASCRWPDGGHRFEVDPATRKQTRKTTFLLIEAEGARIAAHPYFLAPDGRARAFDSR